MVRNIILLTIDALSARHVSFLGYDRATTPNLNDLATTALSCSLCIAQSSHTRESMPAMFASAYPTQWGGIGPLPADRPTLATVLQDVGFATAGFHSNPYLSRAYGFDRGFDTFDDSLPLAKNRLVSFFHRVVNHLRLQPYTRAEELNEQGLNWLDQTDDHRRFLWLHYMDPHGPYQPPAEYQREFGDEVIGKRRAKRLWRRTVNEPERITASEQATLVDLYDAEVKYTDAMVGAFLENLADRGLRSESIVIVAADHGDMFGQHDIYGHPRHLYEELVHVPLLILLPEMDDRTVDRPVENVDIAATILDAVDVPQPDSFEGTSLLNESETTAVNSSGPVTDEKLPTTPRELSELTLADVAVAEASGEGDESDLTRTAIRTSRYKLHVTMEEPDHAIKDERIFDLVKDSEETVPLKNPDPAVEDALWSLYRQHRKRVERDGSPTEGSGEAVDDVVADRLRDLGYR